MNLKELYKNIQNLYDTASKGEIGFNTLKKRDMGIRINGDKFDIAAYVLASKGKYGLIFDVTKNFTDKDKTVYNGSVSLGSLITTIENVEDFDLLLTKNTPIYPVEDTHCLEDISCYIRNNSGVYPIFDTDLSFSYSMKNGYYGFTVNLNFKENGK